MKNKRKLEIGFYTTVSILTVIVAVSFVSSIYPVEEQPKPSLIYRVVRVTRSLPSWNNDYSFAYKVVNVDSNSTVQIIDKLTKLQRFHVGDLLKYRGYGEPSVIDYWSLVG